MAEDQRSLWSDIKLNILDKGWRGDITEGDTRGYEKKQIKKIYRHYVNGDVMKLKPWHLKRPRLMDTLILLIGLKIIKRSISLNLFRRLFNVQ